MTFRHVHLLIIFAATLLCAGRTAAQEAEEAEFPYKRDLAKGRFERAEVRIMRRLGRDSLNLECHYAAFVLYSSPAFDGHSFDKAYTHLAAVRRLFAQGDGRQLERWMRDSFSGALLDGDLRRLCRQAIAEARKRGTVDAYEHFLDFYSLAPPDLRDSMVWGRDSMQLAPARRMESLDLVEDFIRSHPQSRLLPEAVGLRDSLAFALSDRIHSAPAYADYCRNYPKSAWVPRAMDSVYAIEFRHALSEDAEQFYRSYADRYEASPYADSCLYLADSLEYRRVVDSVQWHTLVEYLDAGGRRGYWTNRAVQTLARAALRSSDIDALHQAALRLPKQGAPAPPSQGLDSLSAAVARRLHDAYMQPSVRNYDRFYSRYPGLVDESVRRHDSVALGLYNDYHYYMADSCIRAIAPAHEAFVLLQQLLKDHIDHHRWREAAALANTYADCFGLDYDYRHLVATLEGASPSSTPLSGRDRARKGGAEAAPLGPEVNTPKGDEYAPVISADGGTLYFAARNRPDNIGGEDVFAARREGRRWVPATIEMDLSHTYGNEAPVSISTDGNTLFLFRSGVLYAADRSVRGWDVHPLPPQVGKGTWSTDVSLAPNGRLMLWAARGTTRRHADSSMNIYASLMDSDGVWGPPFELGPAINTPFDERSPLLHPDLHTLYFSSEGHGSMGQMDLFVSHRLSDTGWTQWSEPENVGRAFNTTADDWGYRITADGRQAYFARGTRSQDIYSQPLPEGARPRAVTVISGTVRDRAGRPVATRLRWESLTTGQWLGQCRTDPATGRYFFIVPQGEDYGYYVDDSLYFPASVRADLTGRSPAAKLSVDLTVTTYDQMTDDGMAAVLASVVFNPAGWQVDRRSAPELKRLAHILLKHQYTVEITSHTDGNTAAGDAAELTRRRAEELRQYLIGLGCRPSSITARGMGDSQPASRRGSLHSANRRVEIRLSR